MRTGFLAAISAALLIILGAEQARASKVGFARITVPDPMGGEMLISIWYPTLEAGGRIKLGPYVFKAARDAAPLDGKRGLILISHGTEGSDLGHRNIAIALAQQGLIVAAPLHPRDNYKDSTGIGQRIVMEGRPRQITATIDALIAHEDWGGRIDQARIGAFGFSIGGYTVLAALGAQPEMMRIVEHCEGSTRDPFCASLPDREGALRQQVAEEFAMPMSELEDARICTASLADPVAIPFSNASIASVSTKHIQVWRPENENVLSAQDHASRVVQQLNTREYAKATHEYVVERAQHYSFIAPFPWRLKWVLSSELTTDAAGFDRDSFQEHFANEVAGFFVSSLEACVAGR